MAKRSINSNRGLREGEIANPEGQRKTDQHTDSQKTETCARVLNWKLISIILLLGAAIPFYWNQMLHAGVMCGDEVCALNLATMPLSQLPHWILFDSYPALWPLVLKVYIKIFGNADMTLRIIGFAVQFSMLGAIFVFSRITGVVPRLTAALFLFLPVVINHTGSMRAWGFGVVTIIAAYAGTQKYLKDGRQGSFWFALIASVVAAQGSYYNSFLLFAILAPAIVLRKDLRWRLFLIGTIAAASMLIYVPIFLSAKKHYENLHVRFGIVDYWHKLVETTSVSYNNFAWVLVFLGLLYFLIKDARKYAYEVGVIGTALIVFFVFLYQLHYTTTAWYYIPLVVVVTLSLDQIYESLSFSRWLTAICAVFLATQVPTAWKASMEAQTNIDSVVAFLKANATDKDLIIVSPWGAERSLDYYFKTGAEIISVPPGITNQILTRYDLEQEYIAKHPEPQIEETKSRIRRALLDNQRIIIISNVEWRGLHRPPPTLYEITNGLPNLPASFYHSFIENEQLVNYVQGLGIPIKVLETPHENISSYEYHNLIVLDGKQ